MTESAHIRFIQRSVCPFFWGLQAVAVINFVLSRAHDAEHYFFTNGS